MRILVAALMLWSAMANAFPTKRSALLPEVPTMSEAGVAGYALTNWFGLLAPAGTPREVVAKVHGDVTRILREPDIQKKSAESAQWAEIIRSANIRAE